MSSHLIVEVFDDCVHREYVFRAPVTVPLPVPRFIADEKQRMAEEYLDALIPACFKRACPPDMPTRSLVVVGWERCVDFNAAQIVLRLWLEPNEATVANDRKKLGTFRYSEFLKDEAGIQRQIMNDALRGKV